MIDDISFQKYDILEYKYFTELGHLSRPSISIRVGPRAETYIFTSLYIALHEEHDIEFSHNSMISHHP